MDVHPQLSMRTILLPFLVAVLFFPVLSQSKVASTAVVEDQQAVDSVSNEDLVREVETMKLKVAQLEAILDQTVLGLHAKDLYLDEKEKQLEEIANRIFSIQSFLVDSKQLGGELPGWERKVTELEEEVRLLWAASRRNNFDLHVLEAKVLDAEEKLKILKSQVKNMADIITEQWYQIQQLEQALQITQVRTRKVQWRTELTRCSFMKLLKDLYKSHLQGLNGLFVPINSGLSYYLSQASYQMRRILFAAQKYHYQLQGSIMHIMERHELTAALANEELVFFLASALITFPLISAWMLCTS